jgi:hypothetical protein
MFRGIRRWSVPPKERVNMLPYERIRNVLEGKPTNILPYVDGFSNMEARRAFLGP